MLLQLHIDADIDWCVPLMTVYVDTVCQVLTDLKSHIFVDHPFHVFHFTYIDPRVHHICFVDR